MDDEVQSRLALNFANCFLEKAGQTTYQCKGNNEVFKKCMKTMDSNAFTAFSNFFTHTHNMCQFLMSQMWRENTAKTISTLSETSARAAEVTKQSLDMQDTLLANQAETLNYQKQIAANGSALSQALESSRANARALMEEFRASTDEQRTLIFSIFDRVSQLQSLVVSEVSWFYTVIFYSACLLLVYITTATKRTADARIPLIVLLTLNFVIERAICSFTLYGMENDGLGEGDESSWTIHLFDGTSYSVSDMPQIISSRIWFVRKLTCIVASIILSYFAYVFADYNVMNNKLLQDIQRQNLELRKSLDALQISHYQSASMSQSSLYTMGENQQTYSTIDVTDDTTKSIEIDENNSDSGDSTLSFNSTQTDRTWMVEADTAINNISSDDSFDEDSLYDESLLDTSELNKTFTIEDALNNLEKTGEAHVENVSSTTSMKIRRRSSRSPSVSKSTDSSVSTSSYTTPTRVRRRSCTPLISANSLAPLIENVESSSAPHNKSCYNLRDRKKIMSSYDRWDAYENPLLDSESPNSFGKLVKKMARITEKNSRRVRDVVLKEKELQAAMSPTTKNKTISSLAYSDDD